MSRLGTVLGIILLLLLTYAVIEALIVTLNGNRVPVPDIPRGAQVTGKGPKLTYVILGDSTAVGQGTDYAHSYAYQTAKHLAEAHTVSLTNLGISGAKLEDVVARQLEQAVHVQPDIVLIGVGANDVTHFTSLSSMRSSFQKILDDLKQANSNVRIIATRSPAVDSVSRFPIVSKRILKTRVSQTNEMFDAIISKNKNVTPAHIAEKTRGAFLADPSLTAEDNFHPNARGYALWTPILNEAIDQALSRQ